MAKNQFLKIIPSYRFSKLINIDANIFLDKNLIIFDLDNTLIFSESTETKPEIVDWFQKINKNYRCVCLSNSRTIKKRKDKISKLLGCEIFLSKFKKPSKKLFENIEKAYNVKSSEIIIVGDRVFTDILFGNLNGAKTVLVNPINSKENILIKIIRKTEVFILFLVDSFGYNGE
ncbi:MAG: YqeG family HAD IIIA-type phosphatase [Candidatus Staskawiczbacteria bacterium]|nr:YqeG family HAD IIIA-type phosphatase [Candidatus Staskawiczbacteria bacterium]